MGPLLGLERTSDSRPANYSLLIIENTGPNTGADDADLKRQGHLLTGRLLSTIIKHIVLQSREKPI